MVPRFDIVPIPEHLRHNMSPGGVMEFPAETAQSMFDFRANDVVGAIAPRPLLLLHSAQDSVTPTEQSIEMFKHAGRPTDLHLLDDVDHYAFGEQNPRVRAIVGDWLATYFPSSKLATNDNSYRLDCPHNNAKKSDLNSGRQNWLLPTARAKFLLKGGF